MIQPLPLWYQVGWDQQSWLGNEHTTKSSTFTLSHTLLGEGWNKWGWAAQLLFLEDFFFNVQEFFWTLHGSKKNYLKCPCLRGRGGGWGVSARDWRLNAREAGCRDSWNQGYWPPCCGLRNTSPRLWLPWEMQPFLLLIEGHHLLGFSLLWWKPE